MKKVFIETLGCKINQSESSCILDEFIQRGFEKSTSINEADIIIINTCTVTNRTDYKSRYLIKKTVELKQANPALIIAVTGCYSQRFFDDAQKEEKDSTILKSALIDYIIDNNNKNSIVNIISEKQETPDFVNATQFKTFSEMSMNDISDKSRAFLKIQDGCDFYCSYCAVPYARGKPRSRSVTNIKHQIELLLDNNFKEIVLSGINLGLFNNELLDDYDLANLINDICQNDRLKLIRLSSIEPQLFSEKLLKAIKNCSKICSHFHLPLQSGSDTLLNKHRRRYTVNDFKNTVKQLIEISPNAALGFDVIVGLPGETDELFQETFRLLNELDFTYLHVFIYSKRKNTLAANMKDQVHGSVAHERSKLLANLSNQKKQDYISKLINQSVILKGVVEKKTDLLYHTTSDKYIKAYFKSVNINYNAKDFVKIKPIKTYKDGILCEVVHD